MKKYLLPCLVVLLVSSLLAGNASAQVVNSPIIQAFSASPGDEVAYPVTLRSNTNKAVTLAITSRDFKSLPGTNEPQYLNTIDRQFGITAWWLDSNTDPKITVPAQQSVTYNARFRVPRGAKQQSYFGSVFFSNLQNDPPVSIASIAFIDVGAPLVDLEFQNITFSQQTAFGRNNASFQLSVDNNGPGRLADTKDAWHIKLLQNGSVLQTIPAPSGIFILPGASRTITHEAVEPLPVYGDLTIAVYENEDSAEPALTKTIDRPELSEHAGSADASESAPKLYAWVIAGVLTAMLTALAAAWFRRKRRAISS